MFLRLLACLLSAAILMTSAVVVFADEADADENVTEVTDEASPDDEASDEDSADEDEAAESDDEEEEEEEAPADILTDEQAIARCDIAAENEYFILYYDDGIVVKEVATRLATEAYNRALATAEQAQASADEAAKSSEVASEAAAKTADANEAATKAAEQAKIASEKAQEAMDKANEAAKEIDNAANAADDDSAKAAAEAAEAAEKAANDAAKAAEDAAKIAKEAETIAQEAAGIKVAASTAKKDKKKTTKKDKKDPYAPTLERVGVYVKSSGAIHWFNPVNALADTATKKKTLLENRQSNIAVKYGNATDLYTSSAFQYSWGQSTDGGSTKFELIDNGILITYGMKDTSSTIPLKIVLDGERFVASIDTKDIVEKANYVPGQDPQDAEEDVKILTEIAMLPFMSAATTEDEGYMFVPDGSGAIINLNNAKGNYSDYTQTLYGRDITQVRDVEPDMMEQAYLPVLAMVKGSNGLVMIATEGDTFANVNANVSFSKSMNSSYNNCYFSFTVRSTDKYKMTGDSSEIEVFERGDGTILVPRLEVAYYPITSDESTVTYGEIADVYRNYLIEKKGLKKQTDAGKPALYIDFYGGALKAKSILGFPIKLKTSYTSFNQAADITDMLAEGGVDSMVVNYNNWSEDSMSSKIDTGDSIASVLGGKSAYKKMLKSFADNNVDYYASVSGITYKSNGNGFITLLNTAYRVSKSYSRQYTYNIAYGTPDSGIAAALLSPRSIAKLTNKVTKNLGKYEQGAGLGVVSTTLWSDFSTKYRTNRCTTAQYIIDYYKAALESNGKTIADSPNAYLLPYVTRIENLTLQSSQFKVTDIDIPFYQMVMHGYIDYASEAVNGTPDTTVAVLKAIAAGSNIHYDFMYEEASELINTVYVDKFYCNYEGWVGEAVKGYQLVKEVLSGAEGATIADYVIDGKVITTTYSNGYKTVVDLSSGDIKAGGKTYNYKEYVKGGTK